ncbi:MAG: hypothetical protein WDM80_02620 [Limisphaerales bacterium]
MKATPHNELSVTESITATVNGKTVTGTLWLHSSRRGRFEVEYNGIRKSDNRTDYTNEGHIRGIAKLILQEMIEE